MYSPLFRDAESKTCAGCQCAYWANSVFLYIAAHGEQMGLHIRLDESKRFKFLEGMKDAGGLGNLEELYFLMWARAWSVTAFIFCISAAEF